MSGFQFGVDDAAASSTMMRVSRKTHLKLRLLAASLHTPQSLLLAFLTHRGFEHTNLEELKELVAARKRFAEERGSTRYTDKVVYPILPPLKNWPELESLEPIERGKLRKKRNEIIVRYRQQYPHVTYHALGKMFHISRQRVEQIFRAEKEKAPPGGIGKGSP